MKKILKTEAKKILEGMVKNNVELPEITVEELQNVLNYMIDNVPYFTSYGVPLVYKRYCMVNSSYKEIAKELNLSPEYTRIRCLKETNYIKKYINVYRENIKANNVGITLDTDFLTTCYSEFSSKRIHNSLYRAGISTFGDVKKLINDVEHKPSYGKKCKVKNLGPKGYEELVAIFKSHGGETL